jgi:hypothetical protein
VTDFLLRGHPNAALGAKMIPFFGIREVVVTGCAVALAHPYGSVAGRALGHKIPPERAAYHLGNKIFFGVSFFWKISSMPLFFQLSLPVEISTYALAIESLWRSDKFRIRAVNLTFC